MTVIPIQINSIVYTDVPSGNFTTIIYSIPILSNNWVSIKSSENRVELGQIVDE